MTGVHTFALPIFLTKEMGTRGGPALGRAATPARGGGRALFALMVFALAFLDASRAKNRPRHRPQGGRRGVGGGGGSSGWKGVGERMVGTAVGIQTCG